MEPCVLAIDLGASSGRVIAALSDGKTLRCHEIHRFANEPVACCGSLYWDVLSLFNQIKKGIALAAQRYEVKSLAIDTWGVDFGLLDESGRLIENPVCYRDERTRGILDVLSETIPMPELFAQTGNTPDGRKLGEPLAPVQIVGIVLFLGFAIVNELTHKNA